MSFAVLAPEAQETSRSAWLAEAARQAVALQSGRSFLWCAPALAAGSGLYFSLPAEPGLLVMLLAAGFGLGLAGFGRASAAMLLPGLLLCGFALAGLQGWRAATPLLTASTGEVEVSGEVLSVERGTRKRWMVILAPDAISGLDSAGLPRRLRLTMPQAAGQPLAGSRISLRARLAPLPRPVQPGGFDYGRSLWLNSIGGIGRMTSPTFTFRAASTALIPLDAWLADLRNVMGERIHAALPPPYGSFAEALITGERSTIPAEINRSLLVSGLYHILSISGLHMWLAAGGVFWAVRAVLALVPALALRWPIRKWAAVAALAMGLFYMLLAEGGVATARSFIMVAIVFFAIIVDRPAVSPRNLALAAVILLLLDPEAAIEASFQMSFLAVLGLIAFHEAWAAHRLTRDTPPNTGRHWSWRLAAWAATALTASLLTSFIAGAASSLPAAYHFGRISPYGVLANGLAIPVVGVLVMPFALIAVLLMPLGLQQIPLDIMGKGLELVIMISDRIARLPGANEVIARPALLPVMLFTAAVLVLSLLRGPLRFAGVGLAVVGAVLALTLPTLRPDLLIDATGQNVALRDASGHLVPAVPRRARFAVEKWLQDNGEEDGLRAAAARPGWTCVDGRCTAEVKGRHVVYLAPEAEHQRLDCNRADIVIAAFPLRHSCRNVALRIDRFDLWRWGAQAVFLSADEPRLVTARGAQGDRPWVIVPAPRRSAN